MKKLMSLLLATLMMASVLSGCGGSGATSTPAASGSAASGSAASGSAAAGTGATDSLTFSTGGSQGTYYAFGGVLSQYVTSKTGLTITAIESGGSQNNIENIQDGAAQLAFVQSDVMSYAYQGTNLFKDSGAVTDFSTVADLYMGLALTAGEDVAANTTVISIADTSTILIDATVDERNISYVKAGMPVDLDQWGTKFTGMVESVSLNSKVTNGVAAYPMVISVDNTDGSLMSGSNVTYSLVASQNDNCLTLPIQSVKNAQFTDGSSGYVVFVKADKAPENTAELAVPVDGVPDGYYPVPVEIGISDNYNVEIKSGVEEGTTVFTTTQMQNSYGY